MGDLTILIADITQMSVDAIVNAANKSLAGGGGVDGAIHRAAGPRLLEACQELGGCEEGQVKVTGGYNLHARYVIHTVGPKWRRGEANEAVVLRSCYTTAMAAAEKLGCKTLAFPAIATGAYGYPHDKAAEIAVSSVAEFLSGPSVLAQVFLVALDQRTNRHLINAARKLRVPCSAAS